MWLTGAKIVLGMLTRFYDPITVDPSVPWFGSILLTYSDTRFTVLVHLGYWISRFGPSDHVGSPT